MPANPCAHSSDVQIGSELQAVLDAVVEGVCGLDSHGNATFCNEALCNVTGYRAEEIVGANLHELLHHHRPDGSRCPPEECVFRKAREVNGEAHVTGEFLWKKDGNLFPVEYWTRPFRGPSALTSQVITLKDITELQRARQVLERNEQKYRRILSCVPDVAWTSDRDGHTIYISPKIESVLGYTSQEVYAGGTKLWLSQIHAGDYGRVHQAYRNLFEQRSVFDEEYRMRRKDGAWVWVHDRSSGTHEEDGVLYADGFLCDITARKQAEVELHSKTAFL